MNQKERSHQYYLKHRDAIRGRTKAYREKHLEQVRAYDARRRNEKRHEYHAYFLKYKYGITAEYYAAMLKAQNGICAIPGCGNDGSEDKRRRRLFVDHSHKTGVVRGLLCCNCNRVLGMLKESPVLLRGLLAYLERVNGKYTWTPPDSEILPHMRDKQCAPVKLCGARE